MVGSPKNLHQLRKMDAQVRVTCTSCKATEVWELEALIAEVRNNGGNTDWRAARYSLKCSKRCASPMITLLPIPYGRQEARQQASRHALINLSLEILRDATARSAKVAVGTIEVRLALHVLRRFVSDQKLLTTFWTSATAEPRHPWINCHLPYRHIVQHLVELGAPVEEQNRP